MKSDPFVILLARGGSKRVPGKNLERIEGRSLLEICIETVHAAGWQVWVSSDSLQILRAALDVGAETIFRPATLAGDTVGSVDCVLHATDLLGVAGEVCLVQCTSPFTRAESLREAYQVFCEGDHPFFAARRADETAWAWLEDGPIFPRWQGIRSQQLPAIFLPSGNFYFSRVAWLQENRNFFAPDARPFEVAPEEALDIDTIEDLEIARWQAQRCNAQQSQPLKPRVM